MDEQDLNQLSDLLRNAVLELHELEKQAEELTNKIDRLHNIVYMGSIMDLEQMEEGALAYLEAEPTAMEELEDLTSDKEQMEDRVLAYLEDHPGSSRSEMADAKILHDNNTLQRLRRRGLIVSEGRAKGARWYTVAD